MARNEQREVLLFSGGQSEANQPYFHYADGWLPDYLRSHLGSTPNVLYVPWAIWSGSDADKMFNNGQEHWGRFGLGLTPIHRQSNMVKAVERADAIIVGGGSIHMLVKSLAEHKLFEPIRKRIHEGGLYIGESAGAVVACPTRHSALEPSFINLPQSHTLGLVPFQLTPHYYDVHRGEHHHGPPPSARIRNYLEFNEHPLPVVAVRDGSCLHVTADRVSLLGDKDVRVFNVNLSDERYEPGADLSSLLNVRSHHYTSR